MKFDTVIAPLTPAKYFPAKDSKGSFFVAKTNQKGNTRPVMPCATGNAAITAAKALSLFEKISVALTLQVIAKARAV